MNLADETSARDALERQTEIVTDLMAAKVVDLLYISSNNEVQVWLR